MSYLVFYDDREVYDSRDGGKPPGRGVQVIVQPHPQVGFELVCESDFYVFRRGKWWGVDKYGLWDYLLMEPGTAHVLFGRMCSREEYARIMGLAQAAGKAGFTARERKV